MPAAIKRIHPAVDRRDTKCVCHDFEELTVKVLPRIESLR